MRFFSASASGIFLALCLATYLSSGCKPEESEKTKNPPSEKIGNLTFLRNDAAARKLARDSGRPLFLDFYADWCINCKLFNKKAISNKKLNAALQKAVLLKIYDSDPIFNEYQKQKTFQELTVGLPLFVVLRPDGSFQWKTQDYRNTSGIISALSAASRE